MKLGSEVATQQQQHKRSHTHLVPARLGGQSAVHDARLVLGGQLNRLYVGVCGGRGTGHSSTNTAHVSCHVSSATRDTRQCLCMKATPVCVCCAVAAVLVVRRMAALPPTASHPAGLVDGLAAEGHHGITGLHVCPAARQPTRVQLQGRHAVGQRHTRELPHRAATAGAAAATRAWANPLLVHTRDMHTHAPPPPPPPPPPPNSPPPHP
jgi:hypothetical protein